MLCKKGVLRNFAIFIGKHLCWSLFLINLQAIRHRCFPVNIVHFLRTPILKNICERLFLFKTYVLSETAGNAVNLRLLQWIWTGKLGRVVLIRRHSEKNCRWSKIQNACFLPVYLWWVFITWLQTKIIQTTINVILITNKLQELIYPSLNEKTILLLFY